MMNNVLTQIETVNINDRKAQHVALNYLLQEHIEITRNVLDKCLFDEEEHEYEKINYMLDHFDLHNVDITELDYDDLEPFVLHTFRQGMTLSEQWVNHYTQFNKQYAGYQLLEHKIRSGVHIVERNTPGIVQIQQPDTPSILKKAMSILDLQPINKANTLAHKKQLQQIEVGLGLQKEIVYSKPLIFKKKNRDESSDEEEDSAEIDYDVLDEKTLQILSDVLLTQYQSASLSAKKRRENERLMQKLIWDRREQKEMEERNRAAVVIQKYWKRFYLQKLVLPRFRIAVARFKKRAIFRSWLIHAKSRRYCQYRIKRTAYSTWVVC
jgi:hypothetical protein